LVLEFELSLICLLVVQSLSTDTKKAIVKLVESGLTGRNIAEMFGINPSSF